MDVNGVSGLGKYQAPQEQNVPQGTAAASGSTPTFTECLNILFEKDKPSPTVFTTKYGNIDSGLVGSTVNFLSNGNSVEKVTEAQGKPFITGAQSGENTTFMQKV